ncbi:MAG TPA: methylenetetrahydrofolate reductase [Thermoguttaceae bacterium]|nr:methylenetetrahydrofolate reductase [Thermoguttaceae bacterium]
MQKRIESGGPILLAEYSPPLGGQPSVVRETAQRYAGKVHALGVSENRGRVGMSALAAASLVLAEGVEPILHVITRDRNRIALVSDYLGARALGIHNVLCTTGTHQTLGNFRAAKNVFDIDSTQLLQAYAGLAADASLVGESGINGFDPACLGAVTCSHADPAELQMMRLAKKVAAGAQFIITQPIFDVERFDAWFEQVTAGGIHEKVALLAGIQVLTDADQAKSLAESRPDPKIPEATLSRIVSAGDKAAQRTAGIEVAVETIQKLSAAKGLRGFEICGDGDDEAVLEVIEKSGLGSA